MLSELQTVFPSLISGDAIDRVEKQNYCWFTTSTNDIVGIEKSELTAKDKAILEAFLTPFQGIPLPNTTQEKFWASYLFENQWTDWKEKPNTYRFIFFSLSEEPTDLISFQEAIDGLFPSKVPILWRTPVEGVIVEENQPSFEENTSFSEIIDVFSSDFYLDIRLFISPFFGNFSEAPNFYQWLERAFQFVRSTTTQAVITYQKAIPFLLMEDLHKTDYENLIHTILQETQEDDTLLDSIQIFLECNSNVSLAAKTMYMHRNSLQYRIDKFIEKTGIDVKQFEGAIAVYLVLLLRKQK